MRLNQVTLAVSDLDRSVAFYRRLGIEQIIADEGYARFACPERDRTVSLEVVASVPESATTVYLECDDYDGVVSALNRSGIAFEQGCVAEPWLWREARLRDPDGNRLCLFNAGTSRLSLPTHLRLVS